MWIYVRKFDSSTLPEVRVAPLYKYDGGETFALILYWQVVKSSLCGQLFAAFVVRASIVQWVQAGAIQSSKR